MKKINLFIFSIFLFIFVFFNASFAFAALEVKLPGLSDSPSLTEYVTYLFKFGISLAGVLAVVSFAIGAVNLIASVDSDERKNNAKDRMKGSLLGATLLGLTYVFLSYLSPQFTALNVTTPTDQPPRPTVEAPGVYFYLSRGCTGGSSGVVAASQDDVGEIFRGKIASVKIVNNPANNAYYGVVFHKEIGLQSGGVCSYPIVGEGCKSVDIPASAADIFVMNKDATTSGDGVDFYSEPYGWDAGANAGCFSVTDSPSPTCKNNVKLGQQFQGSSDKICFNYENVDQPDEYKYKCSGSTCGGKNKSSCDPACTGGDTCVGGQCVAADFSCDPACTGGDVCINGECTTAGDKSCSDNASADRPNQ